MMRRTPLTVLAALLAALVLTLSACSSSGGGKYYKFDGFTKLGRLIPAGSREPAKPISGTLLTGAKYSLAATTGRVTLVNFWASWCPPCRIETPQLGIYYNQVKSKGIEFVGIDANDTKGAGQAFVKNNKIAYPNLFDQQGRVAIELGNIPGSLPFTVLLDKQHRVAAVYEGRMTSKDLEAPLAGLAAGH